MRYLLDTNVISEIRKGPRMDPRVAGWLAPIASDRLFLSVLVMAELRRGVEKLRPRDPEQAMGLHRWVSGLWEIYGDRILGVDAPIADTWARLSVEAQLPLVDGLLAATSLVGGYTLVTRNVRHFGPAGCLMINPFGPEQAPPDAAAGG